MHRKPCRMRRHLQDLMLGSTLLAAPATLCAQWRVSSVPLAPGRAASVSTVIRERADSLAADEDAVSFVIQCVGGQLDAFITTRDELESDMARDVRVRIESDTLRARDSRWAATKAGTGAFVAAPDLRELVQRRVLRSSELRLVISTLKRGRVTYRFATAGFRPSLDALRDACPNDRGRALAEPGS